MLKTVVNFLSKGENRIMLHFLEVVLMHVNEAP